MKNRMVLGLIAVLALTLAACDHNSTNQQGHTADVAFGQTGNTSRPQIWYVAESRAAPNLKLPLQAVVITQNGQATAFRVPSSFTLGDATRLSAQQLKQKGMAFSKQDFTHKRQALITDAREKLAVEKENLKKDQIATVVSFAAVKSDRRIVAGYQERLSRLESAKFKKSSPLPFAVNLTKQDGRIKQETMKVAVNDFEQVSSQTSTPAYNYQRTRLRALALPYTQVSKRAVKLGRSYFGYYRRSGRKPGYVLTKVASQNANVKFDSLSIK
ncbi:hypothetical protein [Levilactobacillus tujiorum]|uniref:hypothetical protein n=1 Tax=Levilactobacillus tujiorum TaxID=2912243 RepID=UPI0014572441|nr:hypothetical protein [Levilactobacillus tujiorum]NLR33125.1 hypothetical protein [Levilactobacillus tujiorum]